MQSETDRTDNRKTQSAHLPATKMLPVLMLLMAAFVAADEVIDLSVLEEFDSTSVSLVRCDGSTTCPDGTTCCLNHYGTWNCCPYALAHCCRDGVHCCPSNYYCDATSTSCVSGWMRLSSSSLPASKVIQKAQYHSETVQCEGNVYCSADKFCCKTAADQWGCCSGMEL